MSSLFLLKFSLKHACLSTLVFSSRIIAGLSSIIFFVCSSFTTTVLVRSTVSFPSSYRTRTLIKLVSLAEKFYTLGRITTLVVEREKQDLDVVDECLQALYLAVRPTRDAELPAPLLEHREPDVELPRRLLDRHAEVPGHLLERQHLLVCSAASTWSLQLRAFLPAVTSQVHQFVPAVAFHALAISLLHLRPETDEVTVNLR
jgi:hypothetical protein